MPSLALPLPDLVAFNARVRDRLDPVFKRRWVRRAAWALVVGYVFFVALWLFFANGLPSSEKLMSYEPPLPTNVRGYDGNPIGTYARERRVELSFDEYPPLVVNAFIAAEDKTFFSHGGLDYPGLFGAVFDYTAQVGQRRARARRLDDHPAGRQGSASGRRLFGHAQDPRGDPRLPPRIDAVETADPRALSQPDLPWPQRLWRPGRGARLFRQGRRRTDAARGGLSRRPAQGAEQLRPDPRDPEARSTGAIMCCAKWPRTASSPRRSAPPPPPPGSARSAMAATPSSASRAAISSRKCAAPCSPNMAKPPTMAATAFTPAA